MSGKRQSRYLPIVATALLTLLATSTRADNVSPADRVAKANELYAAGDYEQALEAYKLAEVDCPECPQIAYNEGLARYRLRDFEAARQLFNQALSTRELDLEAKAKFNLGNVAYAQALEKMSNLQEAIESARLAISHYRDALEIDPKDDDARANIETAQLLIKDLLDKQKQQQDNQQQDQQQDKQEQDQQEQSQQDQQKDPNESSDDEQQQEEQEQQPSDQSQQQQDEADRQEQAGEQSADQQQDQQQEEQEQSAREVRELTQEEAERLLQAVRDKEAQRREELAERRRAGRARVSRDW